MLDVISDEDGEGPILEDMVDDETYHKQVLDIMAETDQRLDELQQKQQVRSSGF